MGTRLDRDAEKIAAIRKLTDNQNQQVTLIKNRWRENYDMFVYGSRNDDKEEWQTKFSVPKLQASTRAAQGRLVNTIVNTPDWYELAPRSPLKTDAEQLAKPLQKIMDYYLESASFKRHAGTFFLNALISSGSLFVGWTTKLVQNPKYIIQQTEKARRAEQQRLAKRVTNPQVENAVLNPQAIEQELSQAIDEFVGEAQGKEVQERKEEPYTQIGTIQFLDINPEKDFWDPNVSYMQDSLWRAFRYEVNRYELNMLAKNGFLSRERVKKIGAQKDLSTKLAASNLRYKNTLQAPSGKEDMVELLCYYGPLIIDNEIVKDRYFAIIANDGIILKEGDYPYWEPPGHWTPVVTTAVRQIPFRATGAGIGDNAIDLQRIYDSNWQLICDTFRFGISGLNVVNWSNLADKTQLDEGLYPGMTLEVRGEPEKSFKHIELTSNLENQAHPVQSMLEHAIDTSTGINEMMTGGNNPYSRTAAAETNARLQAGNENVNIIALDLEQNFLVPVLQKVLARVLQFGILEINSNPELSAQLDEDEMRLIQGLTAKDRLEILNQWYKFNLKGFSAKQNKNEAAMRDNELLQIINSGGPLSQLINLPVFLKNYFKNRDIKNPEELLINNSPLEAIMAENKLMLQGHIVLPSQNDDDELHLKYQMPLAQSPYATPEIQQHVQMHAQRLEQMKAAQNVPPTQH